ncbi:MAG: tetratricopeptide repeat protein [Methanothrix sp.]|nr:tetratricopeptide repeat protein [Methanothrix sp.]
MRLRFLVWLGLVFLLGPAAADDIPFVFNESSNDVGRYDSDQLVNISASSPELAGVPAISTPQDSDILVFPDSRAYKTVGEIKNEFDDRVRQKKGQVLFRQGRYEEALQVFDQSIQMNPKNAESWNCKGIALMLTCKCVEAIRCFDVAIALDPLFAAAWNNKAVALYAMGRNDEAISACDRAIELDPRSADAWYIKGQILKTEAEAAFARAGMLDS